MTHAATSLLRKAPTLSFEGAQLVLTAAFEHASSKGVPVAVSVVDAGGNLVAFGRQDGAALVAFELSLKKAKTAVGVGMPTQALWEFISADPAMVTGIAGDQELLVLGGGVPLKAGEQLVGAVGVSGGQYVEDAEVAEAASASFDEAIGGDGE
jgi:uncharacterized protein GlcG (DUF336 family)